MRNQRQQAKKNPRMRLGFKFASTAHVARHVTLRVPGSVKPKPTSRVVWSSEPSSLCDAAALAIIFARFSDLLDTFTSSPHALLRQAQLYVSDLS